MIKRAHRLAQEIYRDDVNGFLEISSAARKIALELVKAQEEALELLAKFYTCDQTMSDWDAAKALLEKAGYLRQSSRSLQDSTTAPEAP